MLTLKGCEDSVYKCSEPWLNSKQNNVLITDEGRAVLCDFGLSQVVEDLGRPTGFTLSNPDIGPVRWQAPEFLEGEDEPATLASDVWSFGCTAFEVNISMSFCSDAYLAMEASHEQYTIWASHSRRPGDS